MECLNDKNIKLLFEILIIWNFMFCPCPVFRLFCTCISFKFSQKREKGREKVLNGKERFGFINLLLWLSFQSACGKGQGGISEIFG